MKRSFTITIIAITLLVCNSFYSLSSCLSTINLSDETKEIPLTRNPKGVQTRSIILESFSSSFNNQLITIAGENYSGNIQVEIIGVNGFTTNFTMSGSGSTSIDISALNTGIYTLRITTSTSIYTGQFVL